MRLSSLTKRFRRTSAVLAVVAVALIVSAGVIAFLTAGATAGSHGAAQAGTLDAGNQPSASAPDREVTVSWTQNSPAFLGGLLGDDGDSAGGYLITRYADGDNDPIPAGDDCDGVRRGSDDPLECTESGLSTGRWHYTVTPRYYNWLGAESAPSDAVAIAPEAPTAVTLVNGGGVGDAWINQANENSVDVDVQLPATSLATDTVFLTISDGSSNVGDDLPATSGVGTVHFTALDLSGLGDGQLTFTVKSRSSYGDDSEDTTSTYGKDATSPTILVSPDRAPDQNGWYNHTVNFSAFPGSADAGSGIQSCDPDVAYSSPDGTGLTVSRDCLDNAGNTGSGTSATFDFDDTNPTVDSVTPDRSPDSNGWYNAPVTWTASGSDTTSAIDTCESLAYTGPDGTGLAVSRSCTDNAGNSSSGSSPTFKFDDTNPSVTLSPGRSPDHNGWYNAPVTWTPSQTDATSGPDTCEAAVNYTAPDSATASVTRTCTDLAGNVGTASVTFQFDDTNPTVTLSPARAPDHNSWYNAPVTWTPSQTDATSGPDTCEAALNYTAPDGAAASVTRTCADIAGNVGSATATFQFDDTDPTVTVTPGRGPDSNGWYNAPVTFTPSGADATSGISVCQASFNYTGPDGTGLTASRTCTDNAGNTGSGTSATFKYDATNPSSTITFPVDSSTYGATGWAAGCPTAGLCGTASDVTSGPNAVAVSIQRQSTGLYWNGSAFSSATQTFFAATGTTSWSFAFAATNFPAGGTYVASSRATDTAANVQSPLTTSTFLIDLTAPALSTLEMFDVDANGKIDRVVATFDESLAACNAPCTTGWTLANVPSGGSLNSVTISGTAATLNITEGPGGANTAVGTFTVALAASSGTTDASGNHSSFAATAPADKAAPVPTNVVLAGGIAGQANSGDTLTLTYSEQLDATSFCTTWTNTGTQSLGASINMEVDVLLSNNGTNDILTIADVGANCGGATNFKFGSVSLGGDYVSGGNVTFTGNGGNRSVITWDPTAKTLTIRLGTAQGPGTINTGVAVSTPVYTPSASLADRATPANLMSAMPFTAPGTSRF